MDPGDSVAAESTTARRVWLVAVLGYFTALGPFTVDVYLPALPAIADSLDAADQSVQLTLTATLLGLALGQLVIGPISDAVGRRPPLVVGTLLHVAASIACFLAHSVVTLTICRALQGAGAAATTVIAMAIVRDLYTGRRAAAVLSRLMLVLGVAPILAPTVGGILVERADWHVVFLALAGLGLSMTILAATAIPETLPPHRRMRSVSPAFGGYRIVLREARLLRMALACALGRIVLWAYVAGSPYVFQQQFGLTPLQFGLTFTVSAIVLIAATQLNVLLLRRWDPLTICVGALGAGAVVGVAFVVIAATGFGGAVGFAVPSAFLFAATGFVMPNGPAVALARHRDSTGAASAVVGCAQFAGAAAAAPLVGYLGNTSLSVAVVATCAAWLALAVVVAGGIPRA